ncbi:MAG TPA: segregation/condensation protein A [Rubrobacteraceae bacterium]|nr:segregation/condensation protein A [Rubrobacteraceae bacterium]
MTFEASGRSLSDFTVELDVYSGPYEWLLALILKEELDIFEVPLRELVDLYLNARNPEAPNALERDTDFAGSAAALILLKSRTLSPILESEAEGDEETISPEQLAERLTEYLKIRRGAQALRERFAANMGHHPTAHALPPRPGRLRLRPGLLSEAARRVFSRRLEPPVEHLGPIIVTLQELASVIHAALVRGPVSYEELVRDMDRLNTAVAFAAALSLAQEGSLRLTQAEPLGPLTLEPVA